MKSIKVIGVLICLFYSIIIALVLVAYIAYKNSPPPLDYESMPSNLGVLAVYDDRYVCAERTKNTETIRKVKRDSHAEMPVPCSCEYDETIKFPVDWESVSDLLCLEYEQNSFCVYPTADENGGRVLSALDMKSGEAMVLLQQTSSAMGPYFLLPVGAGEFVVLLTQNNWSTIKLVGFRATRTSDQKLMFDTREMVFQNPVVSEGRYSFQLSRFQDGYRGFIRSGDIDSLFVLSDTGELEWNRWEEGTFPVGLAPNGEFAVVVATRNRRYGLVRLDWGRLRVTALEELKMPGQLYFGWSPDSRYLIVGDQRLSGAFLSFYDSWEKRVSHELELRADNHMLPHAFNVWAVN